MQDLSITQEYYICAVNEKGRISDFSTERLVCFVAAGLLDLQLEGCLSLDRKNVTVTGPLPAGREYLAPLVPVPGGEGHHAAGKGDGGLHLFPLRQAHRRLDGLRGRPPWRSWAWPNGSKRGSLAARLPLPPARRPSTAWWIWCAPSCWRTAQSPTRWPPSPPCWTKAAA